MKEIVAQIERMLDLANDLDSMGLNDQADVVTSIAERYAQVVSGSGGVQEYFERLVQLAVNKGLEYAKARMNENRIVILNDGTPVMKFADPQPLRARVINEAIKRGAKSNPEALKGMRSTRRFDPNKAEEARRKYEGWSQGQKSFGTQGFQAMQPPAKPAVSPPVAKPTSSPKPPMGNNPAAGKGFAQ